MMMPPVIPSVPERVELIIGEYHGLSLRQVLTLGQLVTAEAPAVREIEAIASQVRDLSSQIQRNRDERARLDKVLREKLFSLLCGPAGTAPEGNHAETH